MSISDNAFTHSPGNICSIQFEIFFREEAGAILNSFMFVMCELERKKEKSIEEQGIEPRTVILALVWGPEPGHSSSVRKCGVQPVVFNRC